LILLIGLVKHARPKPEVVVATYAHEPQKDSALEALVEQVTPDKNERKRIFAELLGFVREKYLAPSILPESTAQVNVTPPVTPASVRYGRSQGRPAVPSPSVASVPPPDAGTTATDKHVPRVARRKIAPEEVSARINPLLARCVETTVGDIEADLHLVLLIESSGHVSWVRIVGSPTSMLTQCATDAIKKEDFGLHDGGTTVVGVRYSHA
jgi:hypothetical protein